MVRGLVTAVVVALMAGCPSTAEQTEGPEPTPETGSSMEFEPGPPFQPDEPLPEGPEVQITADPPPSGDVGCLVAHGLTVGSVGGEPLEILGVELVPSEGWSLPAPQLPITLAPGEEEHFGVLWEVLEAGDASGEVLLETNASEEPVSIILAGTGVEPLPLAVTTSVVARTDLLYVNSTMSTMWCESYSEPVDPLFPVLGTLAQELELREVQWAMLGMGGDLPDLVPDPVLTDEPLVVNWETPDAMDAIWDLFVSPTSQSGSQYPLWAMHGALTNPGLQAALRPGARFLLVARVKHNIVGHWAVDWMDVAAAADGVVVAPDLWTANASAKWADYPSLSVVQELVDYRGGFTHAMCVEYYASWLADVADLAATPTRFVPVDAPSADAPLVVSVDGVPDPAWGWDSSTALIELSSAPATGALVTTEFPGPPVCDSR